MVIATAIATETGQDPISKNQVRSAMMAELSFTLILLTAAQISSLLNQANTYARESVQR